MLNFLSQLFKNKKTIFFIFIFACIIISAPQTAFAGWLNPITWVSEIGNAFINAGIYIIAFIPLFVTALFADIAGTLLKWALAFVTQGVSYTNSPGVNIGWPLVRDLANMFVVMGFIVVGISFTLRIESYGSKKVLINLILAALLINFSLLFCGIFIDGTNIAMNFFFSKIGTKAFTLQNITDSLAMVQNVPTDSWTAFLPKVISLMIFNFFEFFIFILYIILILGRVVALWILVILSPLAFVCYVFPFSRPIWNMWWKNFFQWCIIGVPAGLFLYIGSAMITKMIATPNPTFVSDSGFFTAETIKTLSGFASFLLPGLFLIMGFLISLQFSAMGASTIMNFANKNKGKFMGAGLGALSKLSGKGGDLAGKIAGSNMLKGGGAKYNPLTWAKATVRGAARGAEKGGHMARDYRASAQKTSSALGRLGEKTGLISTDPIAMSERVDKEAKRIKIEYQRAKATGDTKKIAEIRADAKLASEGKGGTKSAASLRVIVDEKDINDTFKNPLNGKLNLVKAGAAIRYAEKTGATGITKDSEEQMPQLATRNKVTIDELAGKADPTTGVRTGGKENPTTGATYTYDEAKREAERRKNSKMSISKMREMSGEQLSSNLARDITSSTMARARLEMNADQKNKWRDNALADLRADQLAIAPDLNSFGVLVPPTNSTHPRHEEFVELGEKMTELLKK